MRTEQAFELFQRAFDAGRMAQAYLIEGPLRGVGQELVEKVLSLIFCAAARKPCGHCAGCRGAREHNHPDLTWVEPQKKSRLISVEQVRGFQRQMFQTSFLGGWKASVIYGADRLGMEASNAFLKVLEEPPGKSVFFLLTDSPQFLLSTITSRCQPVRVSGSADDAPEEWKKALCDVLTETVAEPAIGALATSERVARLFGEVKQAAAGEIEKLLGDEEAEEEEETIDARVGSRYREIRAGLMRTMLLWYRDILLLANGAGEKSVFHQSHLGALKKRAAGLSWRQAQRNVEIVETMNRQFERNVPEKAALAHGFGELR